MSKRHALLLLLSLSATSAAAQTPQDRLLSALQSNRLALTLTDGRPAGPGWDLLVREAGNARFTLIGEEHGVAETAQLAAALSCDAQQRGAAPHVIRSFARARGARSLRMTCVGSFAWEERREGGVKRMVGPGGGSL